MATYQDKNAARDLMAAVRAFNEKIDAMSVLGIDVSFVKSSQIGKRNDNWIVSEMVRTNVERILA